MRRPFTAPEIVAEITGPYGPVSVSEKVIQRLWARGAFMGITMRTVSGKNLKLIEPGKSNPHEGPDFREAVWELAGTRMTGDAEIHFYNDDWYAHGHDRDPEFDRVALHLLVFPPGKETKPVRTRSGREPVTLVLLPHLPEDLESTAAEDALMRAEGRTNDAGLIETLAAMPPDGRLFRIQYAARERYDAKLRFARHRIIADESEPTAHRLFLETLGLRRNRAPMSDLAQNHPIADFAKLDSDRLFEEMTGRWKLAGVRPANHPRTRLRAYGELARQRPNWPEDVRRFFAALPHTDVTEEIGDTAAFRKQTGLTRIRETLATEILAGAIGGTRLDTLVVDALLPWAEAATGRDLFAYWYHWPMGDAPERIPESLATLGLTGPGKPASNGLFQGLLGVALGM
jgi:hypothetical protein